MTYRRLVRAVRAQVSAAAERENCGGITAGRLSAAVTDASGDVTVVVPTGVYVSCVTIVGWPASADTFFAYKELHARLVPATLRCRVDPGTQYPALYRFHTRTRVLGNVRYRTYYPGGRSNGGLYAPGISKTLIVRVR